MNTDSENNQFPIRIEKYIHNPLIISVIRQFITEVLMLEAVYIFGLKVTQLNYIFANVKDYLQT